MDRLFSFSHRSRIGFGLDRPGAAVTIPALMRAPEHRTTCNSNPELAEAPVRARMITTTTITTTTITTPLNGAGMR